MEMKSVKSSNIQSVGYDPATKTLRVEFSSGSTYEYPGVSAETHAGLMKADSCGAYFAKHIRKSYTGKKL
jgi:hypothetical protein